MADVSVRPARAVDVQEIARIQVETWRAAYRGILPAGALDDVGIDDAFPRWAAAVSEPPSDRHHVLVAWEQEWRVGFIAFGPADAETLVDDPDDVAHAERTAAITTVLTEPRWGRRGHGSRMLAAAVDHLRVDGLTRLVTWALEEDKASNAFFTTSGWEPDGWVRTLELDGVGVRERRLHTEIDAEPIETAPIEAES